MTSLDQPVSALKTDTLTLLGGDLTSRNAMQRDWTGLAGYVGFTCHQVDLLQQYQDSGKGSLFLKTWERTGQSSIRRLLYALMEFRMVPMIDLIKRDLDLPEETFETVQREYEQLRQDSKLRLSSTIPDLLFYQVLFHHNSSPRPPCPVPASTEDLQVERLAGQSPAVTIEPRSVYISYLSESSISGGLKSTITQLADMLHHQHFKVYYKHFCEQEIRNIGGINDWKEDCIQKSGNIIVICTPAYHQEDSKWLSSYNSRSTKASKISVDSRLLRTLAYTPSERMRLIPVLLDSKKAKNEIDCVPIWLQSSQRHYWPSGKTDLLFSLEKKPKYELPEIRPEDYIVIKPKVIDFPKRRAHNPRK